MNCRILVDDTPIEHWKRECIDLLSREHAVEVCRAALQPRDRPSFLARLLGGESLRREPIRIDPPSFTAPDVVVDLRANPLEDVPEAAPARLGRWYFCDAGGAALGDLPGSGEIASGSATFTIELRSADALGNHAVLRSGRFRSLYAYARSMSVAMRECKRWPAICLRVYAALQRLPGPRAAAPRIRAPISRVRFAARLLRALVLQVYTYAFIDVVWRVGLIRGSPSLFLANASEPQIEWLHRPRAEFFADPFVFRLPGRHMLVGEALDPATRKGYISCVEVGADGSTSERRAVIRSDVHLSYPYVFRNAGEWYLVPESADAGCISLYRGAEAPFTWKRVATLIDGIAACDSTIVRYRDRWWLFCTDKKRDPNLNLFAYHADDLLGPWTAHTANPIKTDIRSARPAGMPFVSGGELYRPGQDCALAYGDAIVFSRVTTLTEHEYAEEPVSRFGGEGRGVFRSGTHHISYDGELVAIDRKRTIFAPPRLMASRVAELGARLAGGRRGG